MISFGVTKDFQISGSLTIALTSSSHMPHGPDDGDDVRQTAILKCLRSGGFTAIPWVKADALNQPPISAERSPLDAERAGVRTRAIRPTRRSRPVTPLERITSGSARVITITAAIPRPVGRSAVLQCPLRVSATPACDSITRSLIFVPTSRRLGSSYVRATHNGRIKQDTRQARADGRAHRAVALQGIRHRRRNVSRFISARTAPNPANVPVWHERQLFLLAEVIEVDQCTSRSTPLLALLLSLPIPSVAFAELRRVELKALGMD